ncbi:MAG: hypothetical protein KAU94_09865, partial [Verrucomicrobia bacterium]|nr:hypothetical protein [Verrucomicrobiota bacterium]
ITRKENARGYPLSCIEPFLRHYLLRKLCVAALAGVFRGYNSIQINLGSSAEFVGNIKSI